MTRSPSGSSSSCFSPGLSSPGTNSGASSAAVLTNGGTMKEQPEPDVDDIEAHSIWCNCDECIEIVMIEQLEDRVPING